MKESYLESKCIKYARNNGWFVFKINPICNKGAPDRLFIKEFKGFFVEFKTKKGVLSAIQKVFNNSLKNHYHNVIINDYKEFVKFIEKMENLKNESF